MAQRTPGSLLAALYLQNAACASVPGLAGLLRAQDNSLSAERDSLELPVELIFKKFFIKSEIKAGTSKSFLLDRHQFHIRAGDASASVCFPFSPCLVCVGAQ